MVKFSQILNPLILDAEWVGFQGDSEFKDIKGELQLGYWSFLKIVPVGTYSENYVYDVDDDVDEGIILSNKFQFIVRNKKGNWCAVEFKYPKRSDGVDN